MERTTDSQIARSVDLAAQTRQGVAHGFSSEGSDWKGVHALAGNLQNRLAVVVAQRVVRGKALANLGRDGPPPPCAALARRRALCSSGTLSRRPPVSARRMTICSGNGRRLELRLFEDGPDALAMLDDLAGVVIEPRAELGEGFQFRELRVGKLEIARDRAVGRPLRLAADARNGLADIDRGKNAQLEQASATGRSGRP